MGKRTIKTAWFCLAWVVFGHSEGWAQNLSCFNYVVAQDGSGNFTTVQAAFNAVPANSTQRITIYVKNGTYQEALTLASNKTNITLIGQSETGVILTCNHDAQSINPSTGVTYSTSGSSSTYINANGFYANNITFQNSSTTAHDPALAIYIKGDKTIFVNCQFLGPDDTIYGDRCRQYFQGCYIRGNTDFIFGPSTAVFQNCELHSHGGTALTAASTENYVTYGYVFLNCKVTADTGVMTDLGRPWRQYAAVAYLNCNLGGVINPPGWDDWNNTANDATVRFAEYQNTSTNAVNRVPYDTILTAAQAAQYNTLNILKTTYANPPATDNWDPSVVINNTMTSCGATPTFTPTRTFTPTATRTNTPTLTRTNTATNTRTSTPTNTLANTATSTFTPSRTNTATTTRTNTPMNTSTNTATGTPTATRTHTAMSTPTSTSTNSATATRTNTAGNTPTSTATRTSTSTATNTLANTATLTSTHSATRTSTSTSTNTLVSTATNTPTGTPTNTTLSTATNSATRTNTLTVTNTATRTSTGTSTNTLMSTATNTATKTNTPSATNTAMNTATSTATNTLTNTATHTATCTNTSTATNSVTITSTHTAIQTGTTTPTNTRTVTSTFTFTNSATKTATFTATNTPTLTPTNTATSQNTVMNTATNTLANTQTNTPTLTSTHSATQTSTSTATKTSTITSTNTATMTGTTTSTSTRTVTPTSTATATYTITSTFTVTNTFTVTSTNTATSTVTSTASFTPTSTYTQIPTASWTLTFTSTPINTATSVPTNNIPIIYPNPAPGGTVHILLPANVSGTVKVEIFTVAFRKVKDMTYPDVPPGQAVQVSLTDRFGTPLASGIYYIVVVTQEGRSIVKLVVLR